jgi:hypothetical protein
VEHAVVRRSAKQGGVASSATPAAPSHRPAETAPLLGNQAAQAMLLRGPVRAKLKVGGASDPEEREADAVAERVGRGPCACGAPPGEPCGCGGGALKIRRSATANAGAGASAAPHSVQQALSRPGRPLDGSVRTQMEARFGRDFSKVRIHSDREAAASADAIQARAYTVGNDVVFGDGAYSPETGDGRRLLAHELTHVVQGGDAVVRRQPAPAPTADPNAPQAPPTVDPAAAQAAPDKDPAKPAGRVDQGPDRPNSETYYFRSVIMSTDPAFMDGEMRRLIARGGIKGGDRWMQALNGVGVGEIDLPFSAHGRAYGGLRVRSPLDAQRDMQNQEQEKKLAATAVPLANASYVKIRKEATDWLASFEAGMVVNLETVLKESEARLNTERVRYGLTSNEAGAPTFEAKDTTAFQGLAGAASDLKAIRVKIEDLQAQQRALMTQHPHGSATLSETNRPRYDALAGQIAPLEAEFGHARTAAAMRYPALGAILDDFGGVPSSAQLGQIAAGQLKGGPRGRFSGPAGTAQLIGQALDSRQHSIDTVRDKAGGKPDKIWDIDTIVRLTRISANTASVTMAEGLIRERMEERKEAAVLQGLFVAAIALALAIPTGGGSLGVATAVLGAGLSGYLAFQSIQKFELETALTNTDVDKRASALATEEPSAFWVALDVAFAILDTSAAIKAFRAVRVEAQAALAAKTVAEQAEADSRLMRAADEVSGAEKSALGERLRESLARMRGKPSEAAALGAVGRGEATALEAASKRIAEEAHSAETVARVGGHEVKATASGHLVICTECTWLRERFARELADKPELLARMETAELGVKAQGKALKAETKSEIAALADELQGLRSSRRLTEMGPQGAAALLSKNPQLAKDLSAAQALSGEASSAAMRDLLTRADQIERAEAMSLPELEKLLDTPAYSIATPAGRDLRYVRYLKQGGVLPYSRWETVSETVWENARLGSKTERELGQAYELGAKNNAVMQPPAGQGDAFIPDHVIGDPKTLKWGDSYDFVELKDWQSMSDTGNVSRMLDYVEKTDSTLTLYFRSTTKMSGTLANRIDKLRKVGKVKLIPYAGR